MSIIIPAILTNSLEDFSSKLKLIDSFNGVDHVHIDFADNKFVPNQTLMPAQIPSLPLKYMFEAHLMTQWPQTYFDDIQNSGFESMIMHWESFPDKAELVKTWAVVIEMGIMARVAVNPSSDIRELIPYLKTVNSVQLMGVEPGFQGSRYVDDTEFKVEFLRTSGFYGTIIVDGGITADKVHALLSAGADALVVGSAIMGSKNPKQAYLDLVRAIQ